MSTKVIVERQGPIARIRFDTPSGIHILSAETRDALSQELSILDHVPDCRIVIFEATGRTFLAGADLAELRGLHRDTAGWYARMGQKLMNQVADMKPVTVCAIHAPCVGGGCEMALACDFRFGAETARIGLPETSLGLIPGWGGTVRATELLGGSAARRVILTGELLPAPEALRIGLLDRVFPDSEFVTGVDAFVTHLLSRGPHALRRAKRWVNKLGGQDRKKALAREARHFAACYSSLEPLEGIAAFLEKRAPEWLPTPTPVATESSSPAEENAETPAREHREGKSKSKRKRKAAKDAAETPSDDAE